MPKTIGIFSGKGGTGKTVSSINIALALHQFGEDVVVVDADTTAANIGLHLGFYTFPNNLQNVLNEDIDIGRATYMHHTGLKLIPSEINMNSIDADVSKLKLALSGLNGIVIVDAPPGLDKDSRSVLNACDDIIIVTNPEIPTVANAVKVARMATDMKKKRAWNTCHESQRRTVGTEARRNRNDVRGTGNRNGSGRLEREQKHLRQSACRRPESIFFGVNRI